MDDRWQLFFKNFPDTVTSEQLPVKLPRFDLDLCELAGAAADWCHQYLKDRKCPHDLVVFLTQKVINNLRVQWTAEPKMFGYRSEKEDYQALWLMQRVIGELNHVCLNHSTVIPCHRPILYPVWWSSFVLKNSRRQMEDYISVVPYLHTLFDVQDRGEASFFAVYDGHNGLDAAVYSSMYLHQYLVQSVNYLNNPQDALCEAFLATDKGFTLKTEKYNLVSGTTAVCALHIPQEKKLFVGWVGDSIATLWKNGTPLCLVNKHVPDRYDETERIRNEGGLISDCQGIWRVDCQLAVSRAIGDVKYKPRIICQPEMRALVLDGNEEFLVLGSDGLWDFTTPEDVAETIYDELLETDGDVTEVGNKLVFKSKEQGSKDNISVIVVFLQDPKQLVAKRRAVIMETAMEQRNSTSTLASFGQDATDFGPETDVDTPEEPIGLAKPKAEGEVNNVIDESGEDSEEDGGGWNYYKKSTEGTEKDSYKENDNNTNNTGNNSDVEDDMDYKLNPDAPEFVPVSSPPPSVMNRPLFPGMADFISSSPQKFVESIDNIVVPDENDFTNEIKVHAADLSKLDNPHEPINDSTLLTGIKSLSNEVSDHDESISNFEFQNEHIANGGTEKYQNPFVSDDKVDLNKVHDLADYINNDTQASDTTDPFVSIMETSKNIEFNSSNGDNGLQNESNAKLNDEFAIDEHLKYEQDMNSKNIDDTINLTNVTVDSETQFYSESSKTGDEFKSELMDGSHNEKFGLYEDRKLNDSVSTTDAILGSEPHTPMRMDNQSTFESENDDDQFSESFKQQLQFNQFDENNDKENHDPFCFEQIEDPAGIIPNVTHEINEEIDETHQNSDSVNPINSSSNEHEVPELSKHEPVEEPLCVKEVAKPFHSVYEQQYLPESDFSESIHEALLNATESGEYNHENYVNTENVQHNTVESLVENKQECVENQIVNEHIEQNHVVPDSKESSHTNEIELNDSNVDDAKYHIEDNNQEFNYENVCNIKQENISVDSEHNTSVKFESEFTDHIDVHENVEKFTQENHFNDNIQNHVGGFEHHQDLESREQAEGIVKEHVAEIADVNVEDIKQEQFDNVDIQNHAEDFEAIQNNITNFEQEYDNVAKDVVNNVEDSKPNVHFEVEAIQNHVENVEAAVVENVFENTVPKHIDNVSEIIENHNEDFKEEILKVTEVEEHNPTEISEEEKNVQPENNDFKLHDVTAEVSHNYVEDFKPEHDNVNEIIPNHNLDTQQDHHSVESIQNHTTDSDEEMHSSMIIHSDVENNMPQPYCSATDTLINESDMMCKSMTFEENFQNRNMSDSLYVMETSSDYFGEEVQQTAQLNKSDDEAKVEEPLSNSNKDVEPVKIENEIVTETKSELVVETKVEDAKVETTELIQSPSQDPVEKVIEEEESNKTAEIAVAAAVGTAAIAAVAGVGLAAKKSAAPKKPETTISKTKTTTAKTTSTKPLVSKTSAPILKKTTSSTTTSKPLSRPTTAPSTSKPTTNVRPTTAPKTTTVKATTVTKAPIKPTPPKTTTSTTRPTSAKTTPTTPRVSLANKTTPVSSPKTPTTPKTPLATKSASSPRTSTTPRTSTLVTKQPLTNGSPKPLSRPLSAPLKKPLSSVTTNGTAKLTNGDVSKTSTTTKPPVSLSTRMSLAPPKLPPKTKAAPKTVAQPAMPGPIRRPKAPITKKTETATS